MKPTETYEKVIRGNHTDDLKARAANKGFPLNEHSIHRTVIRARIEFLLEQLCPDEESFIPNRKR